MSQATWNQFFINMAEFVATKSKDTSTKVGCVVVGPDNDVRAIGYNGFPRLVDDTVQARLERPAKYLWTEHAERNAVYNAALTGTALKGCTAYMVWFPCAECARALIQSGIEYIKLSKEGHDRRMQERKGSQVFRDSHFVAFEMLYEGDVKVLLVDQYGLESPMTEEELGY
jgi:dCMP deaminase